MCGLAFSSILLSTPPVSARCVDDVAIAASSPTRSAASAGGCGGSGGGSCPSGGAGQTRYGSSSYASASASWSCLDASGVYHDVRNGHACGGVYDDCGRSDGCSGSCYGYWSSTRSWIRGNTDADAAVMS